MRIASLSDIHSNYYALKAVLDDIKRLGSDIQIVVAGDFLNCGPFPRATLELLREVNPLIIRGNHEVYILEQWKKLAPLAPPYRALFAPSRWTANQLTEEELLWLDNLPERAELNGADGSQAVIIHGSPRRNDEGISEKTSDERLNEVFAGEIRPKRLFIHGHTHRPHLRHWRGMVIAGDGSAGIPLDDNIKACYLLAEWDKQQRQWQVEHRRVAYDRRPVIEGFTRNTRYNEGGPFMKLIKQGYVTGYNANIGAFVADYIADGTWATAADDFYHLEQAVDGFLAAQAA